MADNTVLKAARLADVYGQNWNDLSQEERRKYVDCVEAIESAAKRGEPPVG